MRGPAPEVAVHYHLPDRKPFLNLSDLAEEEIDAVMAELMRRRASGSAHRVFGRRYMALRRRTEDKLRHLFIQAGGSPKRNAPHYFTLGHSRWFRGSADDMHEVVVAMEDLPSEVTSVTYPDSFTAMGFGPDFGLQYEVRTYHDRVYRIEEVPELVDRYGIPRDEVAEYEDYQRRPFETYIEVQLWSDVPIANLL